MLGQNQLCVIVAMVLMSAFQAYAQQGSKVRDLCEIGLPAQIIQHSRAFSKDGRYEAAIKCLGYGLKKNPNNRDLGYMKVRVLAWQKKFQLAWKEIDKWNSEDYEALQIKAMLAYYQGDCEKSLRFFDKASAEFDNKVRSSESQSTYDNCSAQVKLPSRSHIVGASIFGSYSQQSQKQSIREYQIKLDYTFDFGLRLFTGGGVYKRDFGGLVLDDKSYDGGLSYQWSSHRFILERGIGLDATFVFESYTALGYSIDLSPLVIYLDYKKTNFPLTSFELYSLAGEYYWDSLIFLIKTYYGTSSEYPSHSNMVKIMQSTQKWNVGLWIVGGKGEASRSYLLDTDGADFQVFGVELKRQFAYVSPYFVFERRLEKSFSQNLYKFGFTYLF